MAKKKISELPAGGALNGTELVPIVQTGTTKRITAQDIANLGNASGVEGSGTINRLAKFTATSTIGNSIIYENATGIGIGGNPNYLKFEVIGGTTAKRLGIGTNVYLTNSMDILALSDIGGDIPLGISGETIGFYTNSATERMRITSAGLVGIGTTSPSEELEVYKSQNGITRLLVNNPDTTNTNSRASLSAISGSVTGDFLAINSVGLYLGTTSNHRVSIMMNGTEYLGINATNGRIQTNQADDTGESFIVGGTARVNGTLQTTGHITSGAGVTLGASNNLTWGGLYGAGIATLTADSTNGFQFYPTGSTGGMLAQISATGLGSFNGGLTTSNNLSWGTAGNKYMYGVGGTQKFAYTITNHNILYVGGSTGLSIYNSSDTASLVRFLDNGNVLIGTTTDTSGYKLQVAGLTRIIGDNNVLNFGELDTNNIYFQALNLAGSTSKGFVFYGTSEYMRIASSGNVLINTSTDVASSKLTINSTTQGVLVPRMTETQINNINLPATGLLVYNTNQNHMCMFDGSNWKKFSMSNM